MEQSFVDTSIFVYAKDPSDPTKHDLAKALVLELSEKRRLCISFQVITEYYRAVVYKLSPGLSAAIAQEDCSDMFALNPQPIDQPVIEAAWRLLAQYSLSWWDSLIVASATLQGCKILYSDDLPHLANYGSLKVVNPFKSTGD